MQEVCIKKNEGPKSFEKEELYIKEGLNSGFLSFIVILGIVTLFN